LFGLFAYAQLLLLVAQLATLPSGASTWLVWLAC